MAVRGICGLLAVTGFVGATACVESRGKASAVVSVAAASSLRELLEAAAVDFERVASNAELEFSFGASSSLARQIEAGADFDVFLSADEVQLERVARHVAPGETATLFLQNRLVLVTSAASEVDSLADLASSSGAVAVGGPEVPAGRYARRWLSQARLLAKLEPRFVLGRSARATASLVASGACPFGFTYATDARAEPTLRVLAGALDGPRTSYLVVPLAREQAVPAAVRRWVAWLAEEPFRERARTHGFLVPAGDEEPAR